MRAGVAQPVEYKLPKLGVAGSIPVSRSNLHPLYLLAALLVSVVLSPYTVEAHRPPFLATESAIPVERGHSRLDTGIQYEQFSSNTDDFTMIAKLTYGVVQHLDFEVEIPYLVHRLEGTVTDGFGEVVLRTKIRFLQGREANPVSIAAQVIGKLPTSRQGLGTGEPDIGFIALASQELFPVTVHLNLGYLFIGGPAQNSVVYSIGGEMLTVVDRLQLVTELAGATSEPLEPNRGSSRLHVLGGGLYQLTETLMLHGALTFGLTTAAPASPDQGVTLGLTFVL